MNTPNLMQLNNVPYALRLIRKICERTSSISQLHSDYPELHFDDEYFLSTSIQLQLCLELKIFDDANILSSLPASIFTDFLHILQRMYTSIVRSYQLELEIIRDQLNA